MDKRLDELNQMEDEIRTNQSNADRILLLSKAFKLLNEVLKKKRERGSDHVDSVQE